MRSNIEELEAQIPADKLPRTFTDAIRITKELGCDYRWIDSLCIIQDDAADWQKESARMGSYYANAILTIAADRASNSRDGCFAPRERHSFTPFRIHGDEYGIPASILVRQTPRRHPNEHDPGHVFGPNDPPGWLCERAWIYQEWALSRRILHFTKNELVWECDTVEECECQAGGGWRPQNYLRPRKGSRCPTDPYARWRGMVQELAQRNLTYHTDRLPALAGLAELMKRETNDEYVCGMWANDPRSLLWCSIPSGRMRRHDSYYAPSWSWASVIDEVKFGDVECDHGDQVDYARIFEMSWIPATLNQYGPAKSAHMRIKGEILSAEYDGLDYYGMGHLMMNEALRLLPFNFDAYSRDGSTKLPKCFTTGEVYSGEKVTILIILRVRNVDDEEVQWFAGLVLKPVAEGSSTHRRIGLVDSRETKWKVSPKGKINTITVV